MGRFKFDKLLSRMERQVPGHGTVLESPARSQDLPFYSVITANAIVIRKPIPALIGISRRAELEYMESSLESSPESESESESECEPELLGLEVEVSVADSSSDESVVVVAELSLSSTSSVLYFAAVSVKTVSNTATVIVSPPGGEVRGPGPCVVVGTLLSGSGRLAGSG
jgi:hypothetical protein